SARASRGPARASRAPPAARPARGGDVVELALQPALALAAEGALGARAQALQALGGGARAHDVVGEARRALLEPARVAGGEGGAPRARGRAVQALGGGARAHDVVGEARRALLEPARVAGGEGGAQPPGLDRLPAGAHGAGREAPREPLALADVHARRLGVRLG